MTDQKIQHACEHTMHIGDHIMHIEKLIIKDDSLL